MKKYKNIIFPPDIWVEKILDSTHAGNGKKIRDCTPSIQNSYFIAIDHLVRKTYRTKPPENMTVERAMHRISKTEWVNQVGDIWDRGVKDLLIEIGLIFFKKGYKNAIGGCSQAYKIDGFVLKSSGWTMGKIESKYLTLKRRKKLKSKLIKKSKRKKITDDHYYCPKMVRFKISKKEALAVVPDLRYSQGRNEGKPYSAIATLLVSEQIERFNGDNYISICSTGREFNKVNRLPSLIRQFITFDGKKTTELDIKSAAASSMTKMISDADERKIWQSLILEGRFYSTLAEYMRVSEKEAKKKFTWFLGGHPHTILIKDWIYGMFPKFYDEIIYKFDNGELAQDTQRHESEAIVKICGHLGASIHDCLLVKVSEKDLVLKMMHEACAKVFETNVIIDEKVA